MRYYVTFPSGEEVPVDISQLPTGELRATVAGRTMAVDATEAGGAMSLRLDGQVVDLLLEGAPPDVGVVARGLRFYARVESDRMRAIRAALGDRGGHGGEGLVTSPMPGRVLKLLVKEGDEVLAGAPVVVVEAMKMENELCAARSGKVTKVYVEPGATVESGAKLVEVE